MAFAMKGWREFSRAINVFFPSICVVVENVNFEPIIRGLRSGTAILVLLREILT